MESIIHILKPNSYLNRLNLWLKERFPPVNFISGFILYLMARSILILSETQAVKAFDLKDVAGLLIPAMHLFLLRVFDEHKDFDSDAIHYPHRVIQRGIFKLEEVRVLGFVAFVIQFLAVIYTQPSKSVLLIYSILWIWTFLMTKEFFVKNWLKSHLFIYGVLHLIITPLLLYFLMALNSGSIMQSIPIYLAVGLSVLTAWLYELSRKIKAPDEETGDQSYSKLWGISKSLAILGISGFISTINILVFLWSLNLRNSIVLFFPNLIFLLQVIFLYKFYISPTIKNRKINEAMVLLVSSYAFMTPVIASWII